MSLDIVIISVIALIIVIGSCIGLAKAGKQKSSAE